MHDRLPILVVDDDSQMLRTIGDILRFKGYDPIQAASGHEGLRAATSHELPPAIALIDLRLPDMDGIELVAQLRRVAPLIEVVILTGHASVDSAVRALREHSYDYLVKPVQPDRLMTSVASAGDRWERRRAEVALEQSELRLRRMFECVSDAVFITDDERRIIDANPAARALTRRPLDDLRGSSVDAVLAPVLQDVDVRENMFAAGMHVHSVRDLSEQRRLEAALHQAQKLEAMGRLAGGVAHDFNNLLTVITGFTTLMLSDRTESDPDHLMLSEIKGAAERGAALTRQLLAFSRKQALAPRVLKLNETVTSIHGIMTRLVGEEVELRLALADDLALVRADPGQIEQVLINLVVNARDAMPRGGMVTISTRNEWASPTANGAPTEHVLIRVSDMGLGIAPEMLDRIFEPFFTTKEPGKGTGLGLATVHGIVEQSGGFVRVTSEVGRGTTFSVYLPKYEPTESGAKWQSTLSGDVTR